MFKGYTISDATHKWVSEFNAIPQAMISELIADHPEDWEEVTAPAVGDRVYVYEIDGLEHQGEIISKSNSTGAFTVRLDDDTELITDDTNFEVERDDYLPMWGTMWSFGDSCDDWWLDSEDGIKLMSDCGFRIYKHDEWGYFFGIDGAGYDFYDGHWIPLYKVRGLQWHDPDV